MKCLHDIKLAILSEGSSRCPTSVVDDYRSHYIDPLVAVARTSLPDNQCPLSSAIEQYFVSAASPTTTARSPSRVLQVASIALAAYLVLQRLKTSSSSAVLTSAAEALVGRRTALTSKKIATKICDIVLRRIKRCRRVVHCGLRTAIHKNVR